MFERTQDFLKNDPEATLRQLVIPSTVVLFAKRERQFDSRKHKEKATLPDIYLGLAKEGVTLLLSGAIQNAVFSEPKKVGGSASVQIAFPEDFYEVLRGIAIELEKNSSESGVGRLVGCNEISLIGLAVCLMNYAVESRQQQHKTRKPATV